MLTRYQDHSRTGFVTLKMYQDRSGAGFVDIGAVTASVGVTAALREQKWERCSAQEHHRSVAGAGVQERHWSVAGAGL